MVVNVSKHSSTATSSSVTSISFDSSDVDFDSSTVAFDGLGAITNNTKHIATATNVTKH